LNAIDQLNAALAGRYAVEREIGAGGMATVYLARDIKHARNVALKVLLPELGAILGVERFEAEIKVTANLQHPNLLPLFDSGEANGLLFYVMPFVEGESLRARLDREKQLPIDEAVRIAGAVASALDYAHRHNVIHRDLKPENILLHDGQPLVADFGIALAVSKAGGTRITQTGLSLGTPQYMSPEQATGDRVIDARADIYSLGAVAYEMLTGEPPHVGSTSQAIIARVLTEKPRGIRMSRPNVPEHVEIAVERALEKLPADRWATAKEFGEALTREGAVRATSASTMKAGAKPASRGLSNRAQIVLAVGTAIVGVIATKAAERWLDDTPPIRETRFVVAMPDSLALAPPRAATTRAALSPDGSMLAYAFEHNGSFGLAIRPLGDPVVRRIPGTDYASYPRFSPDGEWLAFVDRRDRKLKKVPVAGGTPIVLADSAGWLSWGAEGTILFSSVSGVFTVSPDGGAPTRVLSFDSTRSEGRFVQPSLLPDGKHALGSLRGSATSEMVVLSLADGTIKGLGAAGSAPMYDGRGHILFTRLDGALYAAPFSVRKRAITGPAVAIVPDLQTVQMERGDFAVSRDGTLAFVTGGARLRQLVRVDRDGRESLLMPDQRVFGWPRISPDGKRVALEIGEVATRRYDVWVYDIGQRTLSRVTNNSSGSRPGGWMPDGRRIVIAAADSAGAALGARLTMVQAIPWDNSGSIDTLARVTERLPWAATTGPAHSWLIVRTTDRSLSNTGGDLLLAPIDTPSALRPFVTSPANEQAPRLSPDGRFVAYASDETGIDEVYVRPVPGPGGRIQVSNGGGNTPIWARNGKELFYRTGRRTVAATLAFGAEPSVVRRDSLFADTYYNDLSPQFDVFPDGSFLLIREAPGSDARLNVIINWQALLKKP
jgi:Tol biopolymer transport system component